MISIIQRSEAGFLKAITKDNIRAASLANGLTAMHFAIYWPWGLRELIDAGADINCEDSLCRRPIHLAVGCGQTDAAEILLAADCSLSTPEYSYSLLQESLRQGRDFDHISSKIIHALIDRHRRLINFALSVLPSSSPLRKQYSQDSLAEKEAPNLVDALAKLNYHIPASLEIDRDGEGVYDTACNYADIQLSCSLADQLWDGGFRSVDSLAKLNSLAPILQSWYVANLDMVSWFIGKGVYPFARSLVECYSGLHLYAARVANPGPHFKRTPSHLPCHQPLIKQLTDDASVWHDTCRCLCSHGGCTPISVAIKQTWARARLNYETVLNVSKSLHEKLLYRPENEPAHIQQLLDILVFEKGNFQHSCCFISTHGRAIKFPAIHVRRDYRGFESEYQRSLTEYSSKMLRCGCATAEKPVCAVFRDECENRH